MEERDVVIIGTGPAGREVCTLKGRKENDASYYHPE